jgi:fatty-acid peroxygenase
MTHPPDVLAAASALTGIAQEPGLDHTLGLLAEGYRFMGKRFERYRTDIFQTRLMMYPAICVVGEEAARMFYVPGRFTRQGALPATAFSLLQDFGSVATLNGETHRTRKRMFMSLMTPGAMQQLYDIAAERWRARTAAWERAGQVVLHDEVERILCEAICAWSGIQLSADDAARRTREFSGMIDGAGGVGPRFVRGALLRRQTEQWAQGLIADVRAGRLAPPDGSALAVIARHEDLPGQPLPVDIAAIELINVLRPTVAVARFVTFAALALHQHPEYRDGLADGGDASLQFVQEVRRFYPFFPAVGGRALEAFEWRGHRFDKGDWVLLDLYGTNHDARLWEQSNRFRPERFAGWQGNPNTLIPQGGGDFHTNHRCPGEWITIGLMQTLLRLLVSETRYSVPRQNFWIDLSRMPAIPASRVVLRDARRVAAG